MEESVAEQLKKAKKGFSETQRHVDTTLKDKMTIHDKVEKYIGQRVDHFDNIILQN